VAQEGLGNIVRMTHDEHCDELDREIDRFADSLASADPAAAVPSCPGWTVLDLTEHLGTVHRWATRLVAERSPTRIPWAGLTDDTDVFDARWLREGGRALIEALRGADPDEAMWAWGTDQHVRFWSRRQLHETFVHRLDLELATGATSYVDPAVAFDAIDEFLANMKADRDISLCAREGRGAELFRIRSTAPAARWTVRLTSDGYEFVDSGEEPDAELAGPAGDVLMVVLRRRDLAGSEVAVSGDESLAQHWLAQTAFQ
jgi:uncharacterized protein (TIGR03083 family)